MILLVTCLLLVVTVAQVALLLRPRPQPVVVSEPVRSVLDERLLASVVVTLKSGTTFGGVLYAEDRGAVVLMRAEQIGDDGIRVPADGEVVLFREDIDFIQRP